MGDRLVVKGVNSETGEEVEVEVELDNADESIFDELRRFQFTDAGLRKLIDRLPVNADIKSLIYSLSRATIQMGRQIINLGRKLLDMVLTVLREFPSAGFGMIFGFIVGFVVSTIPLFGAVLGPLVTPILMALGLVSGIKEDIKDRALARRIKEIHATFDPLRTA